MVRIARFSTLVVFALLVALAPSVTAQEKEKSSKPKAKPTVALNTPVNLNTATATELEALPGVGAATAKLIIEHRQKVGGFKKVEELMNIKGIGEKSFLKLKPMVTVSPEKTERPHTTG
jgi:competence protein ComEA